MIEKTYHRKSKSQQTKDHNQRKSKQWIQKNSRLPHRRANRAPRSTIVTKNKFNRSTIDPKWKNFNTNIINNKQDKPVRKLADWPESSPPTTQDEDGTNYNFLEECDNCGFTYNKTSLLASHVIQEKKEQNKNINLCPVCNFDHNDSLPSLKYSPRNRTICSELRNKWDNEYIRRTRKPPTIENTTDDSDDSDNYNDKYIRRPQAKSLVSQKDKIKRSRIPRICAIRVHRVLTNSMGNYFDEEMWKIQETAVIGDKLLKLDLMGDTGATVSAINEKYAKKHFPNCIQTLKRSFIVNTAGTPKKIYQFIEITIVEPKTNIPITTTDFYLMKKLPTPFLASLLLLRKLGYKMSKEKGYHHKPAPDETFGTCNNWDTKFKVKTTTNQTTINITPYEEHINTMITIPNIDTTKHSVTRIKRILRENDIELPPERICHISNFRATKDEIEKAKQLTKDKQFEKVNLEHIRNISMELYNKMKKLCHQEYDDVWAKHQFHMKTIPNREFKIDLKDSAKDHKIYKAQYHLNEEKRLVLTYHAMNNIKNGLYEPNEHSIHNVPIIVIKRKDGRMRLAYDLTKLNKYTKDVQSHLPSYNYLFEKMRGRGYNTVTDLKNFFENIKLRESDRDLATVTTPLGRFQLTHATYGFKNIATVAQEISEELIAPLQNACSFIDDIFIKHKDKATIDELYNKAKHLLQRAREMGVLLHPQKTFFFVEEVEFLGYIFSKDGHKPRKEYINKVLKVKKPKTVKEIQAYLGLIQYIARYVHKLADWSHYLTILTRKDNKEKWGKTQDMAFQQIQDRIRNVKMLYHPTLDEPFLVQCDASKYAIAGVLYQKQYDRAIGRKQWKIIEFYSKQIDTHLIKHPIMVKECLAIAYSLNHWKHFLLRRKFFLDTDHKNLISLFDDDETKAPEMRKKPIFRTLCDATAPFPFAIAHLAGKDILLADYLSRDGIVNAHYDEIKLRHPKFTDKQHKCLFMHAIDNYRHHRNRLFHICREKTKLSIPDYPLMKKINNRVFTIQALNLDYKQFYGYDCSKRKYTAESNPNIICTKKTTKQMETKQTKEVAPIAHPRTDNTDKTVTSEDLHTSLNTSIINMLKNTSKVDSSTINKFLYMINLYNGDLDKVSTKHIKRNLICAIHTDKPVNAPNFNVDDMYRRRGIRKRKKTRPFWDIENPHQSKDNNIHEDNEESSESENEHDNELEDELKAEELEDTDVHFSIKQTKHRTMFPYKITPNLAESLYNKLHLPEKYEKIISQDNLKKHQRIDWIGKHIHQLIEDKTNNKSLTYLKTKFPFILRLINKEEFKLENGIIFRYNNNEKRLFIPSKLIYPILEYEHTINNLQHPGVIQMRNQLSKRFYWYKMDVDIQNYVNSCHICQLGKGGIKHKVGKLAPSHITTHGHTVHFDYAGPFWKRVSILVMICESTGYVELALTDGQTVADIVFCLMHYWYPRHGMPVKLITDRGSGFIAEANKQVGKIFGIHNIFTSAYHPQTNAKAERTVQEVKKALRLVNINLDERYTPNKLKPKQVTQLVKELTLLLPAIQFSINQRIHSVTQVSPHMLVFGNNLRSKIDHNLGVELINKISKEIDHPSKYELVKQLQYILKNQAKKQIDKFDDYIVVMRRNFDLDKTNDNFDIGDTVAYYIGDRSSKLKKIRQRFSAPWRVIGRLRHNVVQIQKADNPKETLACHVAMLKRYNKQDFVPLTDILATQTAKERIQMKAERAKKRKERKLKKAAIKRKNEKEDQNLDDTDNTISDESDSDKN